MIAEGFIAVAVVGNGIMSVINLMAAIENRVAAGQLRKANVTLKKSIGRFWVVMKEAGLVEDKGKWRGNADRSAR